MTATDAIYADATAGNPDALDWLIRWNRYCHAIDDLIDADGRPPAAEVISTFVDAATLYAHPFFARHALQLLPVVMLVSAEYDLSVRWERSDADWQRRWADTLRFAGNQMVVVVAALCGGYPRAALVTERLARVSWEEHHQPEGTPV
jgi:hypothetical protein